MTCIAGLVDDGRVFIGGDSAGVGDHDLTVRADPKVFRNGEYLMGFTSSFRMGQLLRYAFSPPAIFPHQAEDLFRFLVVDFVGAMRDCLKSGGFARVDSNEETGGTFLLGCRGRLFRIESDFQVGETLDGFDAVGCGHAYAKGSLFATRGRIEPRARVLDALAAAERWSAGVRGPFHVLSSDEA